MITLLWILAGLVSLLTVDTLINTTLLRRSTAVPAGDPGAPPVVGAPVAGPSAVAEAEVAGPSVAVLLPLRDEAHRVEPALRALLAQAGGPGLELLVLDDGSTDGTADLVRTIAGPRARLLTGGPLPPGWLGKPHACHQLASATTADILVFVDADVVLAPDAVAAGVALLSDVDLVTPYPRIVADGLLPRLVQPLLQWSWLTFLPLRAMERSPRPSLAAAGGQFLFVRAEAYRRAGGHAAVRAQVLEDVALARAVKRSGGRIALADGSNLATCRMYSSGRELVDGYTKSLWAAFGSPVSAGAAVALLGLLYVVPPLAFLIGLLAGVPGLVEPGLVGYALGVLGRVRTGRATGARVWPDALAHPLSIVLFGWLVALSYRRHRQGRLTWKGRPIP